MGGKQIKEYQLNSEMLEATKLENDRLNSEIQIQVSIADNYKKLWEVYKKNAEGKVKDAKGDEVELTKRLVDLEKDLDKTTERYRAMFLKYSFAFSRKDEYKNCYFKLKLASEKEKERLEKQKQKLEESIEKWKAKAENQIEKAESRATELMSDVISIRLRHDTELNNLRESHDNSMKKIQKENEQLSKELAEKKQEVKNQRKNYGERMTDVRIRLDEAKAEERIIKAKLYANQATTDQLEANLKQKEKENIDMKEKMEMENRNNVKLWKEEVENLKKKLNEKTKVNTQETSPKETFMGDDTMFSSASESRGLEDLSTTGHLGDTEGLDNTKVQADLDNEEELTSSEVPWPQQPVPKRRRLSNETNVENNNTEAMDITENGAQTSMIETSNEEIQNETSMTGTIPKKKTTNSETLELETQREAMAKENKILREQNKIQLEQHHK